MNHAELVEAKEIGVKKEVINWKDSPSTQGLLDVISSILAEEYIMIAKQNPTVFSVKNEIVSGTPCPRNDGRIHSSSMTL